MTLQNIKRASYLLLVSVTILFLTACSNDEGIENPEPDPNKPIKPGDYKDLEKYLTGGVRDITFDTKYIDRYTQNTVTIALASKIVPGLEEQSDAIKNQYNDWRPTGTKSTEFANTIRGLENTIYNEYFTNGGFSEQGTLFLKDKHDSIATALGGLFDNQSDANLFRTRLSAFRTASYINQRNQGDNGAGKAAELETLLKQIEQLSGTQIVRGDNTVKVLITDLINTVPETAGPGRYNLLQQLEDFSQSGAWRDDVKAVGLIPDMFILSANIIQPSERLA